MSRGTLRFELVVEWSLSVSKMTELTVLAQRVLCLHPGFEAEALVLIDNKYVLSIKRIDSAWNGTADPGPTYRLFNDLMNAVQEGGFRYIGGRVRMLGVFMEMDADASYREFRHSAGSFRLRTR
jgi:hypothetical protein